MTKCNQFGMFVAMVNWRQEILSNFTGQVEIKNAKPENIEG